MENIKEKVANVKEFAKKHKKAIILTVSGIATAAVAVVVGVKTDWYGLAACVNGELIDEAAEVCAAIEEVAAD